MLSGYARSKAPINNRIRNQPEVAENESPWSSVACIIDLRSFARIGGFHSPIERLRHNCCKQKAGWTWTCSRKRQPGSDRVLQLPNQLESQARALLPQILCHGFAARVDVK